MHFEETKHRPNTIFQIACNLTGGSTRTHGPKSYCFYDRSNKEGTILILDRDKKTLDIYDFSGYEHRSFLDMYISEIKQTSEYHVTLKLNYPGNNPKFTCTEKATEALEGITYEATCTMQTIPKYTLTLRARLLPEEDDKVEGELEIRYGNLLTLKRKFHYNSRAVDNLLKNARKLLFGR